MKVVKQPFRSRRNRLERVCCLDDGTICLGQDSTVVVEPLDERPTPLQFGRNTLRRGQTFRVLLEALHAEELGPDGYLGRTRTGGPEGAEA